MPFRVRWSASTRKGRCPTSDSSRSCGPEPLRRITAGNGPGPRGRVSVPASEILAFPFGKAKISPAGTLTLPRGPGPFPAVILLSGSGPHDRDESLVGHRPFLVLADHLTRKGIAVLRFDKRGIGKSTGDYASATTE